MLQLLQFFLQLLQLIQIVTDMCKGALARHGNPVFASNSIGAKMCKEIKTRKAHSVLWQEVQIDIDHT